MYLQFKPQIKSNEINHKFNIALMLTHRLRRWVNIKAILDERHMTDVLTENGGYREMYCGLMIENSQCTFNPNHKSKK